MKFSADSLPSFTVTVPLTDDQFAAFLPKVESRYYMQWSRGWLTLRALITLDEVQAMARGEPVGLSGLEMLMNGSWVPCPRTNEALREQWYFTGQYVESDEPEGEPA